MPSIQELSNIDFAREAGQRIESTHIFRPEGMSLDAHKQICWQVASSAIIQETLIAIHDSLIEEIRKQKHRS